MKVRDIIKEIVKIPHEDIVFMLEEMVMNETIAKVGLKEKKGMGVGFGLKKSIHQGLKQAIHLTFNQGDNKVLIMCLNEL